MNRTKKYTKNLTTMQITNTISKEWYCLDHLGSTKTITDQDGKRTALFEYRSFGDELRKIGLGNAKYKFQGKELDKETNLQYFNARYYDSTIGRFISVDPIQSGTNWYVAFGNNPLNRVDPTGLENTKLTKEQISDIKDTISNNWEKNQFTDRSGTRWFDQNIFDNVLNINQGVYNLGCNLTTNINILSQEYTKQNPGKSMSQDQLVDLFVAQYNASNISHYSRLMKPEVDFLNTGNESLGLKGQWENKANSSPMVLAPNSSLNNKTFFNLTTEYKSIKQQSPLGGSHFVNGEKPNIAGWRTSYFDVYYGKEDRVVGGNKVSEKTLQNIRIIE